MITASRIDIIRNKIKRAIANIEKEENITVEFGSAAYNSAFFTTKIKVKSNEKNEAVDKALLTICKNLGFTQNIIGMSFIGTNGIYKIVDIKTKNRKYPVIAESQSKGTMYKFSVSYIKKAIGGDQIINRNANLDKLVGD